MRLNTKIVIIILEIGLIPLLLFGFIGYSNTKQQIIQNTFSKLDAIAQIQKNRLLEILRNSPNPSESEINNVVNDYTGLGDTGETLLAKNDGQGNALFITAIRFDKNAAFTRVVPKEKTNVASVRAIRGIEGTFYDAVDYRDVPVFAATRYIEGINWGIVVKIDQTEALAPVKKLQGLFLFLITMTGFFIILIGIFIARSITNPIKNLTLMTEQLAKEFSTTTTTTTTGRKDEINLLGQVFNSLAVKLRESYATLEQKVRERTQDLENASVATRNVLEDLSIEKSRVEEARLKEEALLKSVGEGVVATDKDGKVIIMNKVAEDILGFTSIDLMGKSFIHEVSQEDEQGNKIPDMERPITLALISGKVTISNIYHFVRKDGSKVPVAIAVTPVITDSKTIGAILVFRDITKEKEIDQAKTEFVSLASHQLRTPLTSINWYAEMSLAETAGKVNPKQKKYLREIYTGSQRMVELVNSLLNVSRLELGTFKVEPKLTNITTLAQSVLDEQKPKIEEKKLVIMKNFNSDVPTLLIDPKLLRMVFQNLIANAVEYTPLTGKITIEIALSDGKNILVKVSDTGYGIPKHQQDKIFTKFFRADNVRAKDTDGTGLGLYIVKSIVEQSGGKIWFESEENKGTTFYVTLPLEGMRGKVGTKELT